MWTKKVLGPDGRACAIITLMPDGSASGRVFPDGEPAGGAAGPEPAGNNHGRLGDSEKLITLEGLLYEELSAGGAAPTDRGRRS